MSLGKAIHTLSPATHCKTELKKGQQQASQDLKPSRTIPDRVLYTPVPQPSGTFFICSKSVNRPRVRLGSRNYPVLRADNRFRISRKPWRICWSSGAE